MTGQEARAAFLAWMDKERRASPHTLAAYGADLSDLLHFLARHHDAEADLSSLGTLRPADLRAFLAARAYDGAGNATRARQLSAVRAFLRFLSRHHGLRPDAIAGLRGPRLSPPAPRALREAEARDVAAHTGDVENTAGLALRDTALFTLLYGCGLRISEALALDVRDAPTAGAGLRVLGKGGKQRVVFNEITKKAIQEAFSQPGELDIDRVNAQQARRFLDRVVGYMVSPLLWAKIARGLSAGRVQSVAVKLVVEREREIRAFIPEEYWEIHADLGTAKNAKVRFEVAREKGEAFKPLNEAQAMAALENVRLAVASRYRIGHVFWQTAARRTTGRRRSRAA